MKITKLLALLLAAILVFAGCGNKTDETSEPSKEVFNKVDDANKNSGKEEVEVPEEEETEEDEEDKEEDKDKEHEKEEDKKEEDEKPEPEKKPSPSADAVLNRILSNVDTPGYELVPINEENFEYFMFTDYIEGAKGYSADALISSTAHSVCLIELPAGTNASEVAAKIKRNADPRKWVCVEAEAVEVAVKDNMVLLVMSDSNTTSQIISNFKK